MTRASEHIFVNSRTSSFECARCGNSQPYVMPIPVTMFLAMSKAYERLHRGCKAPPDPDATPPIKVMRVKGGPQADHNFEPRHGLNVCTTCGVVRNAEGSKQCSGRLPKISLRVKGGAK